MKIKTLKLIYIYIIHRSRIYFGGEYVPRERCREEFYPISSTPGVQMQSDMDSMGNNTMISPPSNVSSVLYTVQRVVTTSQIQTASSFAPSTSVTSVTGIRNDVDMVTGIHNSTGN